MENANELRIGNIVEYWRSGQHHPIVIESIHDDCVNCTMQDRSDAIELSNIMPILLTDEKLITLGFEVFMNGMFLYAKKAYTRVNVEHIIELQMIDENTWMFLEGNLNVHLKTVHHLQNFWFFITGFQELNINI